MNQFLEPASIREVCAYADVDEVTCDALIDLAQRITADKAWLTMATQMHTAVYGSAREPLPECEVSPVFGEATQLVALLIALDGVRLMREAQRSRAIPEAIVRASCDHPVVALRRYRAQNDGRIGMDYWLLGWCSTICDGNLYRLGRIQFMPKSFDGPVQVYRHRADGRVLALSVADKHFDTDGFRVQYDLPGEWTSISVEDDATVMGNPIAPQGFAHRTPIRLNKAEWPHVFGPGDAVLEMHIPDNDSFTLDVLHDSFKQAITFFPQFLPQHSFKAFVCESWLFNTQLQDMLGPKSNLVRFQRQGYLFPLTAELEFILYFIFWHMHVDITTAPRDTRLRRAILDHLQVGKPLRSGGFFFLRDDVSRFGSEPYLENHQS